MAEMYTCPRRVADGRASEDSPFVGSGPNLDMWESNQCSYDGSVHPDVFMEYVRSGKEVGVTDKSYKFYLEELEMPVRGAKKFYTHHLSEEQGWEFHKLWQEGKINWGQFAPYVPLYIPGPSTKKS